MEPNGAEYRSFRKMLGNQIARLFAQEEDGVKKLVKNRVQRLLSKDMTHK